MSGNASTERVVIYSTSWCPECINAKALLDQHGVRYREIDGELEWGAAFRDEIEKRTGGRTVPQIVIDGQPIGGHDDLTALAEAGDLARLS